MALFNAADMLRHARRENYALPAFPVKNLETLTGVVEAAENCHAPLLLVLAEEAGEVFAAALESAARHASVPAAVYSSPLNNADAAVRAMQLGCNGIALGTQSPDSVAAIVRACGVPLESAPGGAVEGMDSVALADDKPQADSAAALPLSAPDTVLNEDKVRTLIAAGVAKITCAGALESAADACLRDTAGHSYADLNKTVKEAARREAGRLMRLCGAAGQAEAAAAQCAPWRPVEHLIIYNTEGADEQQSAAMMEKGRGILAAIPGVREVVIGETVKEGARYRYCWLIRFVHRDVIDSYREHPEHVAFADNLFRPIAGDRVSIDYQHW